MTSLKVEFVDMHYGTGSDPMRDPYLYADQLHEISQCHQVSRGCFFLCLVGNEQQDCPLPITLTESEYTQLVDTAKELDLESSHIDQCYCLMGTGYILAEDSNSELEDVRQQAFSVLQTAAKHCNSKDSSIHFPQLIDSAVEFQFKTAHALNPDHIVGVVREFSECPESARNENVIYFKQHIKRSLPDENLLQFVIPWREGGVDAEWSHHEAYLSNFQDTVTSVMQTLINRSIEEKPEINARNKVIQEVFKEALVHLALCQWYTNMKIPTVNWSGSSVLEYIRSLMVNAPARHGPILIQGGHGAGKTSILTRIYTSCEDWFDRKIMRVIRFSGTTPRSSYNLELLRIICEQLCLLLQPSAHCIPQDASFDPLYVNNWFQTLIRRFDEDSIDNSHNHFLVILIDDIHRLNPLDSDIVAALSWLPINLPHNVHIIGTTNTPPDVLKLTPVQRERFKSPECYIELPPVSEDLNKNVNDELDKMEILLGKAAMTRLGCMLTATEYGLCETEILELLMPTTEGSSCVLNLSDGYFNFSTFCNTRKKMSHLLLEKFMSGRILLCWRYELLSKVARKRYLHSQDTAKAIHAEIANLFFSEFTTQQEEQIEETGEDV